MKMSEQIDQLATALSEFQGEVIDVAKDKKGYNYKYADLTGVLEIARPLMKKHGLSITQFPGGSGEAVKLESILMHKSGQWISCAMEMIVQVELTKEGKPKMSLAQSAGSVITYMRRYSMTSILGISQQDDDGVVSKKEDKEEDGVTYNNPNPKITKEQAAQLRGLIQHDIHRYLDRMKRAYGVDKIEDLTCAQFLKILNQLSVEGIQDVPQERKIA